MIAVTLGVICYALLLWMLALVTLKVAAPQAVDWIVKLWEKGWQTMVKVYWTVRFEEDDEGLWQIVEDAQGGRYRIHIRDDKGVMKW